MSVNLEDLMRINNILIEHYVICGKMTTEQFTEIALAMKNLWKMLEESEDESDD